jgi:hypothetical protein
LTLTLAALAATLAALTLALPALAAPLLALAALALALAALAAALATAALALARALALAALVLALVLEFVLGLVEDAHSAPLSSLTIGDGPGNRVPPPSAAVASLPRLPPRTQPVRGDR